MKRTIIYLALLSVTLLACRGWNREMLTGTWQAVILENQEMDSFFINSQAYIDTVGKGHDSATNVQLYGVANMDSMRQILQLQYDSTKAMQMDAVTHTTFRFRKDSVAELFFDGKRDTSEWRLDKNGTLILVDKNQNNTQRDTVKMEIIELSDSKLMLKFMENNASSIVTFRREGK